MHQNVAIIIHDTLDPYLPLHRDMWRDIAAAFSVPHIYKADGEQQKGFVVYSSDHKFPGKKVCLMTPAEADKAGVKAIELTQYEHPEECTYIFGPDNEIKGWQKKFDGEDMDYVYISTPSPTELHSFTAASYVLWDRWRKLNGGN